MACHGYANGCRCAACTQQSANFPKRLSSRKEVREETDLLRRLGFVFTGPDSSGHFCFEHEDYGEITVASTPSSRFWRKRQRHRLARLMGLSRWQLERVIAGQSIEKTRTQREPRPGRKSNEAVVMEHAMGLGIPCDRTVAKRIIGRFGSVKAARRALDGMARAAERQQERIAA